ncbi:NUDIX hydrolase domain-like protein [Absidia repens]|uniref:NUDIX hydrolase domain-like protein n=1 Tax=Absidia repens TaxID=90262 RepID=A0A1X2I0P9_9FUNG|nr:NUDIX hydrolase domain-like protein [Absidia repens]
MEQQPTIEYAKKARHGRGNDVVDDNNIRQVAGCLPIDPVNRRFLLISSSNKNKDNWVLPKGGWEDNETQAQAALRETWEEAGIKGRITRQLGIFEEATKKQIKAHHWIFELEIDEVCKKFPEKKKRERRWVSLERGVDDMKHLDGTLDGTLSYSSSFTIINSIPTTRLFW